MPYITGTVIIGTVKTAIFPTLRMNPPHKYIHVWNTGPAAFTSGVVEAGGWGGKLGTADATSFPTLGSGSDARSLFINDPRPFFGASAAVASGSVATVFYAINY